MRVGFALVLTALPFAALSQGANFRDLTQLDVPDTAFEGQDWQRANTGIFPFELVCTDCDGVLGINTDIMDRETASAGAFAMEDMTPQEGAAICDNRAGLCNVRAISIGTAKGFSFDVGDDGLYSSSFVLYSGDDRVSLRASGTSADDVALARDRALDLFGPQLFGGS